MIFPKKLLLPAVAGMGNEVIAAALGQRPPR